MVGRLTILIIAVLSLGGCADGSQSRAWELEGRPGLLLPIRQYYDRNAQEEGGRCKRPLFDAVLASEIVDETSDLLVVDIRHRYRGGASGRRRSGRGGSRRCSGIGERTFTLRQGESGCEVVDMSGPRRRGGLTVPTPFGGTSEPSTDSN